MSIGSVVDLSDPFRDDTEDEFGRRPGTGIGGADLMACLDHPDSFVTPWELWARKSGVIPRDPMNQAMYWGLALEQPLAEWVEARHPETKVHRTGLLYIAAEREWQVAAVDAFLVPDRLSDVFEAHRPEGFTVVEFKTNGSGRTVYDPTSGEIPDSTIYQVQWYMSVCSSGLGVAAVLQGGRGGFSATEVDVERDDELIEMLVVAGGRMWDRVLSGEAPPMGSRDAEVVRRFPVSDQRDRVDLSPEAVDALGEIREVADQMKALKGHRDELEAFVKAELGEIPVGVDPMSGDELVTWDAPRGDDGAPVERVEFTVSRLRSERPDLYRLCEEAVGVRKPGSRRFSIRVPDKAESGEADAF
jgi:predicted phage-related endonuclease